MLMRAYSKVDEGGRIAVRRQFWRQLRLASAAQAGLQIVRIKGSGRKPYLFVYYPDTRPRLNDGLECVVWEGECAIDEAGRVCLSQQIVEDTCFSPGARAELKLAGPSTAPWLTIRWRGPAVASTLQERMNVRGLAGTRNSRNDKWRRVPMEY